MVGTKINRDQRERHPKGYTNHEVIALRAGGPAGRPYLLKNKVKKSGTISINGKRPSAHRV